MPAATQCRQSFDRELRALFGGHPPGPDQKWRLRFDAEAGADETPGAADVAIVPLRIGGGTRLKILDAMALGVPVVATTIGAEGIDAVPGRDLVIADSPLQFARAVAEVATSPAVARGLAEAGRALVEERYDWKRATAPRFVPACAAPERDCWHSFAPAFGWMPMAGRIRAIPC